MLSGIEIFNFFVSDHLNDCSLISFLSLGSEIPAPLLLSADDNVRAHPSKANGSWGFNICCQVHLQQPTQSP